jgi:hypothetical protein
MPASAFRRPRSVRIATAFAVGVTASALSACGKRAEEPPEPPVPAVQEAPPPKPVPPRPSRPKEKQPGGDVSDGLAGPLAGLLGGSIPNTDEAKQLLQKYTSALVGTWTADLGGGVTEEWTYSPSATFTAKLFGTAPQTASGKYSVQQLVGTTGLRVRLDDGVKPRSVTVTFEGQELEHPSLQQGVTGTFRKK